MDPKTISILIMLSFRYNDIANPVVVDVFPSRGECLVAAEQVMRRPREELVKAGLVSDNRYYRAFCREVSTQK